MAAAYGARVPYPGDLFDAVADLCTRRGPVLEIGAGNGRFTFGLADRVDRLDAVEPSAAMIAAAGRTHDRVRWINATFEDASLHGPYTMAVAAESMHWTDWPNAFPKLVDVLMPGSPLALVGLAGTDPAPWHDEMMAIIVEYSINDEFEPYELVSSLIANGWFDELGRHRTALVRLNEPVDRLVQRMHSANGLAPSSLGPARCAEFDRRMTEVLCAHAVDGCVASEVAAEVAWGRPLA